MDKDKPECYHSVFGCVNCNNWSCKNGSMYVKDGNSCLNRVFPEDAEEELCSFVNSQNH